ncbi:MULTISPECIES: FecR family protein [unclassified Spirosoma]|uniref:FecR family protein n=1 Tax=unclassified Spirosoma TaxID=2621999 RepID=UPI00096206FC|nr:MULTISPECIES: FecR domain-containing protein [unclassified Spirosoma]MBN8826715.1 FecR domain-containing protein [Spirosoma sp.]OJW73807.1 MAG: hypothetical protein BGO59_17480 [Spirosoma sp. 48-14]
MKSYSDYLPYDAEAFLMDASFRAWIAKPTPEMTAYWQGLVETYPHLRDSFEQARLLAQGLAATWIPFSEEYTADLFQRTLANRTPDLVEDTATIRQMPRVSYWTYTAAALIPLLLGVWSYLYFFQEQLIQNGNAQFQTLTLYDGSEVRLNANSQLRIPSRFHWRSNREVWLTGEGFFAVQKQKNDQTGSYRKFTVHAERADVAVLGTRFTVYSRSQRTQVLLEEGRIALTDPVSQKTIVMKPGQLATYQTGASRYTLALVNAKQQRPLMAWRDKLLVFENASMAVLGQRFREVYGVQLVLEGEDFADQQFTGELPLDDQEKALRILSETFGLKAVPYQNRIYFIPSPVN